MSDADKPGTLGRGRGRGAKLDPEVRPASSSTSGKRESDGTARGNGNGNGQKRGNTRDNQHIPYRTNPLKENSKQGTSGREVMLSANYFRLNTLTNFSFNLYRVDFEPDIDVAGLRKRFVFEQKATLGGYVFDGVNLIYLTHRLPREQMTFQCETREKVKHQMTIKNTGKVVEMTDGSVMQIFNIILKRAMDGLDMKLVGRNMYDPASKVTMGEFKLELWPGYITSIRQHEQNVLICSEVSHKVMRQETIYDLLRTCRQENGANWQQVFAKEVIGSVVLTKYNNATYRVDDIDWNSSPSSTFDKKGVPTSYTQYYQERWKIQIRDPAQPMLVSNPKARDVRDGRNTVLFLIPELCNATGLTDKMRNNFTMMRAMATHTQMNPENRRKRLLELTSRWSRAEKSREVFREFNTEPERGLVTFKGRALKQEKMIFGGGATIQNNDFVDWTKGLQNSMFFTVPLQRWMLLYPSRAKNDTLAFLDMLIQVGNGAKYTIAPPKLEELRDDRTPTYIEALKKAMAKDPKMIMVIVPNNAADRYAAIKRATCVENAIPTQVIVQRTMVSKKGPAGVMSIATKVMVQLNCKLGGAPWMIEFPIKGTMTIGYDVTHDTKDRSKSYGAFIASMDLQKNVEYFSAVSAHKNGEEMSANIQNHILMALKQYKSLYGALPERIFFYRDGVGEGDIEYVHSKEVKSLENRLKELYLKVGGGKEPRLSFIIVSKRINTRIFLQKGANVDNPPSGTVVDNTITLPERYDFFLISQCVRQGTVAPTSYNVIHDQNGLSPDKMQMLTYKQTHLYYNWSGCTRVPAVVQYAHKLAFLVGQYLHSPPSDKFGNVLYFL